MECQHEFISDDGEYVCPKCGQIGDRIINEGAEWRNYDNKEESRAGFTTSELLPESSYGSIISFRGISSTNLKMIFGNAFSHQIQNIYQNMTLWN